MVDKTSIKSQFLFNPIFESEEQCRDQPFVFEKFDLGPRKEEYPGTRIKGPLLEMHKNTGQSRMVEVYKDGDDKNTKTIQLDTELREKYYILSEDKIYQFRTENDKEERGILYIKNCRLKRVYFKDESGKYIYGFILMAKNSMIEFYSESQDVRNEWIDQLALYVIQLDVKNEYDMGALIGSGNFARVHLCSKKEDPEQKFAMKSIEKSMIKRTKQNTTTLIQEIDVLRDMDHPGVIKIFAIFESNKYLHLLMPYLSGGELFERMKAKGLYQEKDAVGVMKNLLVAVQYLNEKQVVHRDLKPENLILATKDPDAPVLIADFGLASYVKQDQKLTLRCGSAGYIAPEVLNDQGYGIKADMFSCGVIFYILLSGRPVFCSYNINEVFTKNKKCEIEYPSKYWDKITPEGKDLVAKMLSKDPDERIDVHDALKHPWFECAFDKKVELDGFKENIGMVEKQGALADKSKKEMGLASATPVMAGRKLQDNCPQSPFFSSNANNGARDNTPLMRNIGIQQNNGAQGKQITVGGVVIKRVGVGQDQKINSKINLPVINLQHPSKRSKDENPLAAKIGANKPGGVKPSFGQKFAKKKAADALKAEEKKQENNKKNVIEESKQEEEKKEPLVINLPEMPPDGMNALAIVQEEADKISKHSSKDKQNLNKKASQESKQSKGQKIQEAIVHQQKKQDPPSPSLPSFAKLEEKSNNKSKQKSPVNAQSNIKDDVKVKEEKQQIPIKEEIKQENIEQIEESKNDDDKQQEPLAKDVQKKDDKVIEEAKAQEEQKQQPAAVNQQQNQDPNQNNNNNISDDKSSEQDNGTLLEIPAEISNFVQVEQNLAQEKEEELQQQQKQEEEKDGNIVIEGEGNGGQQDISPGISNKMQKIQQQQQPNKLVQQVNSKQKKESERIKENKNDNCEIAEEEPRMIKVSRPKRIETDKLLDYSPSRYEEDFDEGPRINQGNPDVRIINPQVFRPGGDDEQSRNFPQPPGTEYKKKSFSMWEANKRKANLEAKKNAVFIKPKISSQNEEQCVH